MLLHHSSTCVDILKHRTKWENDLSRQHFEAGVYQDKGNCVLALSHMPDKILKLLTMVGIDCDRQQALDMQAKCSKQESSYHSLKAKLGYLSVRVSGRPLIGCAHT